PVSATLAYSDNGTADDALAVTVGGATPAALTVGGESLTGTFGFTGGAATVTVSAANVGLSFGTFVVVTGGAGSLTLAPDGAAGTLTVTSATFTVPTLVTGTFGATLAINTRPVAAGSLPAGPFVRVELTIADASRLTVGGGSLSGSFAFERQADATGTLTTLVGLTGVKAWLGSDPSPTLTDGQGAFVLTGTGVAGYIAGTAAVSGSGFSAGGRVLLRVNTTGGAVSSTLTVGGVALPIAFTASDGSLFEISIAGGSLDIGGVVTVEGNLTWRTGQTLSSASGGGTGDVFGGSGLRVFMGDGPATLADGSVNPLAHGLLISNATLGLVKAGSAYALDAEGDVALLGFQSAALTGRVHVRVNTFAHGIGETIAVAGTDTSVTVTFDATNETAGTSAFSSASGTGLRLDVLGQTMSGDFTFARSTGAITLTAAHAGFVLADPDAGPGARGPPLAQVSNANGTVVLSSAGVAGALGGTVALGIDGVSLSAGRFLVLINTTTAAATLADPADATKTVALPSGPYVRVAATGATLAIAGQSLTGDFSFEHGAAATQLELANVTTALGSLITLQNGHGELTVTAAGAAGRFAIQVATNAISAFSLSAGLSVAVNTTPSASGDLPAGPYARVEVSGLAVSTGSGTLTADLAFENAGAVVRVAIANGAFAFAPVIALTGGHGYAVLSGSGIAAQLGGTIVLSVPGVTLDGALTLAVNTTGSHATQAFSVGGVATTLDLDPGTSFAATGASADVMGQRLSGDFAISSSNGTTTIAVGHAAVSLADGLATLTGGSATFTLSAAGIKGTVSGKVAFAVSGIASSADLTADLDTTAADRHVRITGASVHVTVAGADLQGTFSFERRVVAGASVVTVGVSDAGLSFGSYVTVMGAAGQFVIGAGGVAGQLAATASVSVPTLASVTGAAVAVQVNT
ncbi:MAG: large repetitive protein, partial [Alphaproteobacteria bacterium]|nr:large repetitive protein [Alphaproteobacteria bacterium]